MSDHHDIFTALITGFTSILVSEIGDKTFLIAATMSLKYNRIIVYLGSCTALLFMTVLSVLFGYLLPSLFNK